MASSAREILHRILHEHESPDQLGKAVALGIFIGVLPLYGLHLPLCIAFASLFRLNRAVTYLAANISNPLMAPALVAAGIAVGEWMRFGVVRPLDLSEADGFIAAVSLLGGSFPDRYLSCLIGDAALGAVFGPLLGLAVRARARQRAPLEDS